MKAVYLIRSSVSVLKISVQNTKELFDVVKTYRVMLVICSSNKFACYLYLFLNMNYLNRRKNVVGIVLLLIITLNGRTKRNG